jgi:DNA topoisomerase IB
VKFPHGGEALLRFRGKSGVEHEVSINDKTLVEIVHQLQELPGQYLFQYVDDNQQCHRVDSTMVNEYLHEVMGQAFTAKDFRTWNATVRAIDLLTTTALPEPFSERACKTCINTIVKQVADELRNTPAVCRKSYINPGVFTAWRAGQLTRENGTKRHQNNLEKKALSLLKSIASSKSTTHPGHQRGRIAT